MTYDLTSGAPMANINPMGAKRTGPGRPRDKEGPLARWLDKEGISREAFAGKLRVSRVHVDRLCRVARRPSLALALKIEKATGGAVPVAAWTHTPPHSAD